MAGFDPYFKWLGIPASEQPPNHYRLLGIPEFVDDADVIEHAANQRMAHIHTFSSGKNAKLSQRLLNQISSAKVCLLNVEQKAQYDAQFAVRRNAAEGATRARWRKQPLAIVSGAGVLILLVTVAFLVARDDVPLEQDAAAKTASKETQQHKQEEMRRTPKRRRQTTSRSHKGRPHPATGSETSKTSTDVDESSRTPDLSSKTSAQPVDPVPISAPSAEAKSKTTVLVKHEQQDGQQELETGPRKLPMPSQGERDAVVSKIKKAFQQDISNATTAEKRLALSHKLMDLGKRSHDDAVLQYVLYRIAGDLAVKGGDAEFAIQAINRRAAQFDIDVLNTKTSALVALGQHARTREKSQRLATAIVPVMDELLATDKYVRASRLGSVGAAAAHRSKERHLVKQFSRRNRAITDAWREYEEVQSALSKLSDAPEDADANLVVGKFYCLRKGDWKRGLPHLTLGSNAELRGLATKDSAVPASTADQLSLADGWWNAAQKASEPAKGRLLHRAEHWYLLAKPDADSLQRILIDRRLTAITAAAPTPPVAVVAKEPIRPKVKREPAEVDTGPPGSAKILAMLRKRRSVALRSTKEIELVDYCSADQSERRFGVGDFGAISVSRGSFAKKVWAGKKGAEGFIVFGPYSQLEPGRYLIVFRIGAAAFVPGGGASLNVASKTKSLVDYKVADRQLPPGKWQLFEVPFVARETIDSVEYRVWQKHVPILVDGIYVYRLK